MNQIRLEGLRSLPIVDYLASLGRYPLKKIGDLYIYHSPLHNLMYPTFCVNTSENRFVDLADSIIEGDVLHLTKLLKKVSLSRAVNLLEEWIPEDSRTIKNRQYIASPVSNVCVNEGRVTQTDYPFLLVEDIPNELTNQYLSRLEFSESSSKSSKVTGIGMRNDFGGFIIYQRFRIQFAVKNGVTTFVNTGSDVVQVFENIFDFLKYLHKNQIQAPKKDVIILNFRGNHNQLAAILKNYRHADLFLNLDTGGIQLRQMINKMIGRDKKQHSYDQ